MLLRTCPVLGTINAFLQDWPQDACPMHYSHRTDKKVHFLLSLPILCLFPLILQHPSVASSSEQSKLLISNQLSPSPSGRAALGHGGWGSRDCGVTVCVHVCIQTCVYIYLYAYVCESMYRSHNWGVGVMNVQGCVCQECAE